MALRAHSDIRKASGSVITTEPLGFVLTKEVNVFLLRVIQKEAPSELPLWQYQYKIVDSDGGAVSAERYPNSDYSLR